MVSSLRASASSGPVKPVKMKIQHLQYADLFEDVLINLHHKHKKGSDISALFSLVNFRNSLIGPVIIQPFQI